MSILRKLDKGIEYVLKGTMILSVLTMALILSLGVFYRIFLNGAITASSEICNYCIILITFGCGALVVRYDKQVKISYLFDIAKWPIKRVWAMVINLCMAALMSYMGVFALNYALQNLNLF